MNSFWVFMAFIGFCFTTTMLVGCGVVVVRNFMGKNKSGLNSRLNANKSIWENNIKEVERWRNGR